MAHTIKVIALGFVLLAACLVVGRVTGNPGDTIRLAAAARIFVPLWLIGAGINMWIGVTRAGYSVSEELPFFFVVFLVPAVVALAIWWKYAHH